MEIKIKDVTILIDQEDYDFISKYKWYATKRRETWSKKWGDERQFEERVYICRSMCMKHDDISGGMKFLSRELMNAPEGMVVVHRNENTFDYRKSNLVVCTMKEWRMRIPHLLHKDEQIEKLKKENDELKTILRNTFLRAEREKSERELNDAYDMVEGLMKHIDSYNPCQTLEQNYENIINKE